MTIYGATIPSSTADFVRNEVPQTIFRAQIHRNEQEVTAEVNDYFLKHWPFENEKARMKFIAVGFSRVTCYYFPLALDDRIALACRLITLLFLIDDQLEFMSLEEGSAYNERLIAISRGTTRPDYSVPVEWITYDLWNDMCACDIELADDMKEPVFTFMRAQVDTKRLCVKALGEYLEYRERDVGQGLLSGLIRFTMRLRLDQQDLYSIKEIETNCSKHISVVNDIYSWDKELKASKVGHKEGAVLCSAVSVLSAEMALSIPSTKRVLWVMCREWELQHKQLVVNRLTSGQSCSYDLQMFMKGLEFQMSGNEVWSSTTSRYHPVQM
ncbi:aristolochene synthase [Alternaria alternata]|uniref:Terpene synthase n=1 Tax=Alternaria alternata TaxID=5599 RepID=A0A177D787_ALTAL|nr:aristolochene synthase [Alternaria alternata]OAG15191.1 aristolochene synthase [Alternaria alternata]CAI9630923.1 unnamed protein product [Alternaria burnsii]